MTMEEYAWKWLLLLFECNTDRRCPNSEQLWRGTCRNLNCTFCKFKIALSFWKDKQTRPRLLVVANFITCLPTEIPRRGIAFIPSSDACAKDGGYREQGLFSWPFLLVMYWYCCEENRCWPLLRPIGLRFACAWWTRGLIPPFPSSSNCWVVVPRFNTNLMKNSVAHRASIVRNFLTPELAKTSNVENYTRMTSEYDNLRNLDFRAESPQTMPHNDNHIFLYY